VTPDLVILPTGTRLGDRYRIVRLIGCGGMGAVYEAEGPSGNVAVKLLAAVPEPQYRARFTREATVCMQLSSPHCVPVIDHGIDAASDMPFLVMPLLKGDDLGTIIARVGAIEPAAAVSIFLQACRGLEAAHAAGIVHRDIKPANVFLDDEGVKLCDFGLAKVYDGLESLTRSGTFLGTPHYVSPEQATNAKRVDERSDVWSLAMSLYHALAGVPAFGHVDNVVALVFELTGGQVRHIQDMAPWVEPELARVLHGALIRDTEHRCPSIRDFARCLSALVAEEAPRAEAVSEATRAKIAPRAELPRSWSEVRAREGWWQRVTRTLAR
jgi:serine/threonine-protein kinase